MVQIYDLDSDTEGLQLARGLDDDGAVFAASSDATQGIRMTPKIPPSFDGTTSWFEYEDLIDDWLGIMHDLDPEKTWTFAEEFSCRQCRLLQEHVWQHIVERCRPRTKSLQDCVTSLFCQRSSTCVLMEIFAIVPNIPRKFRICSLDRKIRDCSETFDERLDGFTWTDRLSRAKHSSICPIANASTASRDPKHCYYSRSCRTCNCDQRSTYWRGKRYDTEMPSHSMIISCHWYFSFKPIWMNNKEKDLYRPCHWDKSTWHSIPIKEFESCSWSCFASLEQVYLIQWFSTGDEQTSLLSKKARWRTKMDSG